MNPLVSILIPFKNTQDYIEDCLNSILRQSYLEWEAIFVDDNSEDNTHNIIAAKGLKDSRIKVLKNDGTGIIEALRTAFRASRGEFITRMDSDDIMVPHRLEWMTSSLIKSGKGNISVGLVKYFRSDGISDGYARYERWLNGLTKNGTNYTEIYKECAIPSPCWMVYRTDFNDCGAFNSDRYPEDYDLTFRFYENNLTCIPCSEVLLLWRDYPSRTSRTHVHYAQNYFLDIKTHYFLKLDYDHTRPLAIWGAGYKGKTIAKLLLENDIPFFWICNNPNKIGKSIYNQRLLGFNYLEQLNEPQSIVTVANAMAQKDIRAYFNQHKMKSMQDYFFFC